MDAQAAARSDDDFAAALRGFGPPGLLAMVAILLGNALFVPLSALLVLAWARTSRTPWRELGFARPRSWVLTVAGGIALGIALKLLMKAAIMPLLGAAPVNARYHYLAGNTAALPAALYAMVIGAGFGEETVFRGWAFERLGRVLGGAPAAKVVIVLLTSLWFGAMHWAEQGLAGVEQATLTGLSFGAIFAVTGRIWLPMVAHAAFDLTALALIYYDLEAPVAQLLWR